VFHCGWRAKSSTGVKPDCIGKKQWTIKETGHVKIRNKENSNQAKAVWPSCARIIDVDFTAIR
jgi:hypothetical protein